MLTMSFEFIWSVFIPPNYYFYIVNLLGTELLMCRKKIAECCFDPWDRVGEKSKKQTLLSGQWASRRVVCLS